MPAPPIFQEELILLDPQQAENPLAGSYSGKAGSDGSMINIRPVMARRADWGTVQADATGKPLWGHFGTCPDRKPSSHRAEVWGIERTLARATLPLHLICDNLRAVKAFARGRAYCCDSKRPAAELRRAIWAHLDRLGGRMASP